VTAEGATPVELTPFATPQAALARQAAERGQAQALVFPESGARLDFAGWQAESEALARSLLGRGLKPGDHVALLAENRVEWPVVQIAVAMMGGVLVPLNTHYRAEELRYADYVPRRGVRAAAVSRSPAGFGRTVMRPVRPTA
jgi:fatty-acyl-CoA synthase